MSFTTGLGAKCAWDPVIWGFALNILHIKFECQVCLGSLDLEIQVILLLLPFWLLDWLPFELSWLPLWRPWRQPQCLQLSLV